MTDGSQAAFIDEESYESIEGAVLETERGRWFLAEYTRRNRQADNDALFLSIARLQKVISQVEPNNNIIQIRKDLARLADDIDMLSGDIATSEATDHPLSHPLQALVIAGEKALFEMSLSADYVRDLANAFRDNGGSKGLCDELDLRSSHLLHATESQAALMRRVEAMVELQTFIRNRLDTMLQRNGGDILAAQDETEMADQDLYAPQHVELYNILLGQSGLRARS